jgi:hypothetical protein
MTDLILSTLANLCCMSCTSSRTKPRRSDRPGVASDEDDAETLRKAAAWRERLERKEEDREKRRSQLGMQGMEMQRGNEGGSVGGGGRDERRNGNVDQQEKAQSRAGGHARGPSMLMQTEEVRAAVPHARRYGDGTGGGAR